MKHDDPTCYLCTKIIDGEVSRDHVPPRMFFGRRVRRDNDLQLLTLPTHPSCNGSFRKDEEYFVYSLAPIALESLSGEAVVSDIVERLHVEERNEALVSLTLDEFDKTPSGLKLSGEKVVKRMDGKRVDRIMWKIVRGLHKARLDSVMPDRLHTCQLFGPEEEPWVEYRSVLDTPSLGNHPAIFDFKRLVVSEGTTSLEMWALLFWDKIVGIVMFHSASCECADETAHVLPAA